MTAITADKRDETPEASPSQRRNFEEAFSSHCSGCLRTCECGTVFYDYGNSGYSWEEGELEALQANPDNKGLEYAVGSIVLDGCQYVMDCTCWHKKADRIMAWMTANANEIATWLNLEKQRKLQEASDLVSVE